MATSNTARDTLWPNDSRILVRVCFLYVGQGSSILVIVRDGTTHRALLVDSNLDKTNGGIDVAALLKDLLPDGTLYAFVNTHPHNDHLKGLKEIADTLTVDRVWHTDFDPGKKAGDHYDDLQDLIADVKRRKGAGAISVLKGSKSSTPLLDAEVYTLAPAEHVKEDIDVEDADARYARIHEYCAVLRFGKGADWILVTGDADLDAFQKHITGYHKERLAAFVLDASHHGSRSFFKKDEKDEPYLDGLKAIDPEYVVISAPTSDESPHDHPHDDAVKLYTNHVGAADNVLHTGAERETFIVDIRDDGTRSKPTSDGGKLAEKYGLDKGSSGDGGGGGGGKKAGAQGPFKRPPGPGEYKPTPFARSG